MGRIPQGARDELPPRELEQGGTRGLLRDLRKQEGGRQVSEDESNGVTITLKAGKGYDAPWVVLRGATVDEAHAHLDNPRFHELLQRVTKAGMYFASGAGLQSAAAPTVQKGQPPAAAASPKGKPSVSPETGAVSFQN